MQDKLLELAIFQFLIIPCQHFQIGLYDFLILLGHFSELILELFIDVAHAFVEALILGASVRRLPRLVGSFASLN